jgi:hypothetical protein
LVKVSLAIRNVGILLEVHMDLRIIEHLVQLVWELRLVVYYLVKKMAGQLGNKITTIQKLKVIQIDLEENILVIKDLFQENLVTY